MNYLAANGVLGLNNNIMSSSASPLLKDRRYDEKSDVVELVMLFSTACWDHDVYTNQQTAFDLLECHGVPFDTVDASDTAFKSLRNTLWSLVTNDDNRSYPQFFLRKTGEGTMTQTYEYFGDITALEVAAAHWTLLQKLVRGNNSASKEDDARLMFPEKTCEKKINDHEKPSQDEPKAKAIDLTPKPEPPSKTVAHEQEDEKASVPPTKETSTIEARPPHALSPTRGTTAIATDSSSSNNNCDSKVILLQNEHNQTNSWSVADHLDKAKASTARLDALMARAAALRELTILRSSANVESESSHDRSSNSRVFVYHEDHAAASKDVDKSFDTCLSSSVSTTGHSEEASNASDIPEKSVGGDSQESTLTENDVGEIHNPCDLVDVQPFAEHEEEEEATSLEPTTETEGDTIKEMESDIDALTIPILVDQVVSEETPAPLKDETEASLKNEQSPKVQDDFEEIEVSEVTEHTVESDQANVEEYIEEVEISEDIREEDTNEESNSPLEETPQEASVDEDPVDAPAETAQESGEDLLEEVVDAETTEESKEDLTEELVDAEATEESGEDLLEELVDAFDPNASLALGDFHGSCKFKDVTETTEMESFSQFADSMGSLGVSLVSQEYNCQYAEKETAGVRELGIVESPENSATEEEDDDEEEDDSGELESSILVLIATQTTNREVPYDQQNALYTLESYGVSHFTMDGSDPVHRQVRNELFKLSQVGPQYPQFFRVCGDDVTFLGCMDDLDHAIETQRLGEWLTATTECP